MPKQGSDQHSRVSRRKLLLISGVGALALAGGGLTYQTVTKPTASEVRAVAGQAPEIKTSFGSVLPVDATTMVIGGETAKVWPIISKMMGTRSGLDGDAAPNVPRIAYALISRTSDAPAINPFGVLLLEGDDKDFHVSEQGVADFRVDINGITAIDLTDNPIYLQQMAEKAKSKLNANDLFAATEEDGPNGFVYISGLGLINAMSYSSLGSPSGDAARTAMQDAFGIDNAEDLTITGRLSSLEDSVVTFSGEVGGVDSIDSTQMAEGMKAFVPSGDNPYAKEGVFVAAPSVEEALVSLRGVIYGLEVKTASGEVAGREGLGQKGQLAALIPDAADAELSVVFDMNVLLAAFSQGMAQQHAVSGLGLTVKKNGDAQLSFLLSS